MRLWWYLIFFSNETKRWYLMSLDVHGIFILDDSPMDFGAETNGWQGHCAKRLEEINRNWTSKNMETYLAEPGISGIDDQWTSCRFSYEDHGTFL